MDLTTNSGLAPLDRHGALAKLDDVARDAYHPATRARVQASRASWTSFPIDPEAWGQAARFLTQHGFIYNATTRIVHVPAQWVDQFRELLAVEDMVS